MEAIAKTKHLKGSPRKARLVIDMIRGRNVSQALAILKFTDKRAAEPIAQTLRSAIANATYLAEQQNIAIDPDDLWVKTCFVDMGPTKNRRRMRPAPQGRAYREQRHYCHITIQLTSDERPADSKKIKADAAKPKKAAATTDETAAADGQKKAKKPAAKKEAAERTKQAAHDEIDRKATAKAADLKDTQTQLPSELNETQQADEKQLDENEQLERQ